MQIIDYIDTDKIKVPKSHVRSGMPHRGIRELGESIKNVGMLNPLVVRPGEDGTYLLVSGARRLKAAREIGMQQVPVVTISMDDATAATYALVDNLQREALQECDTIRAYSARIGRDAKVAFCKALGWNICRITEVCRSLGENSPTQPIEKSAANLGRVQVKGGNDIRIIDNTIKKTVEIIGAQASDTTMCRDEVEDAVLYTIRVKKPI